MEDGLGSLNESVQGQMLEHRHEQTPKEGLSPVVYGKACSNNPRGHHSCDQSYIELNTLEILLNTSDKQHQFWLTKDSTTEDFFLWIKKIAGCDLKTLYLRDICDTKVRYCIHRSDQTGWRRLFGMFARATVHIASSRPRKRKVIDRGRSRSGTSFRFCTSV